MQSKSIIRAFKLRRSSLVWELDIQFQRKKYFFEWIVSQKSDSSKLNVGFGCDFDELERNLQFDSQCIKCNYRWSLITSIKKINMFAVVVHPPYIAYLHTHYSHTQTLTHTHTHTHSHTHTLTHTHSHTLSHSHTQIKNETSSFKERKRKTQKHTVKEIVRESLTKRQTNKQT
jgi:hypothetical protein